MHARHPLLTLPFLSHSLPPSLRPTRKLSRIRPSSVRQMLSAPVDLATHLTGDLSPELSIPHKRYLGLNYRYRGKGSTFR